jgi:hypothetical protein
MRLALDIYEGQNLARKNDLRIRPRRAGASQFAPVDSLGPGAFARTACAWRSIFTRASASPCKMTTASDHVAGASQFAPVDSLGCNRELVTLG